MKTFMVNEIITNNNVLHGIVVDQKLVFKNFETMSGKKMAEVIFLEIKQNKNFYFIERFCQYVVYVQFRVGLGISMKFSDFGDNIDNVLDQYLKLEAKNWDRKDTLKYVETVQQIIDNKNEIAEMVVVPMNF